VNKKLDKVAERLDNDYNNKNDKSFLRVPYSLQIGYNHKAPVTRAIHYAYQSSSSSK